MGGGGRTSMKGRSEEHGTDHNRGDSLDSRKAAATGEPPRPHIARKQSLHFSSHHTLCLTPVHLPLVLSHVSHMRRRRSVAHRFTRILFVHVCFVSFHSPAAALRAAPVSAAGRAHSSPSGRRRWQGCGCQGGRRSRERHGEERGGGRERGEEEGDNARENGHEKVKQRRTAHLHA